MNKLEKINETVFESIKHIDENGNEYWYARELQKVLEYNKWENFEKVINKAINACNASGYEVLEQFLDVRKPIIGGNGNIQYVCDYKLSRYACHLISQNGAIFNQLLKRLKLCVFKETTLIPILV